MGLKRKYRQNWDLFKQDLLHTHPTRPTVEEYETFHRTEVGHAFPSRTALINWFGTWREAMDFVYGQTSRSTTILQRKQEEYSQLLKKVSDELGLVDTPLTGTCYETWRTQQSKNYPSISSIRSVFRTWDNALHYAQLTVTKQRYTKEECLELLKRVAHHYQEPQKITIKQYATYRQQHAHLNLPHHHALSVRFGSWTQLLEEAGFHINFKKQTRYTPQACITSLQEAKRLLGSEFCRRTYSQVSSQHGWVCDSTILARFGTWNKALRAARIQPKRENYSKSKAIQMACHLLETQQLTYISSKEYDNWCTQQATSERLPSSRNLRYLYGSWKQFMVEVNAELIRKKLKNT